MIYIKTVSNEDKHLIHRLVYSALDKLLYSAFGVENAGQIIKKAEFGKPYIENANFDFSVSHTDNAGVIAVCGQGTEIEGYICIDKDVSKIGVDIECADREISNNSLNLIMNKYYTEQEREYVNCGTNDYKLRFLEVWTKKESIVKATGEGVRAIGKTDVYGFDCAYLETRHKLIKDKTYIISVVAI